MRWRKLLAACLVLQSYGMSVLAAQEIDPGQAEQVVTTAIVPVIGRTVGLGGVVWTADIFLTNPSTQPLDVILTAPGVDGDPFLFMTLQPGESSPLPDLAADAFGVRNDLAPLLVHTLADYSVNIDCVIRGTGPDGAVRPQVPRILYGRPSGFTSVLSGLRIDEEYRTNIGLANVGDAPATASLSLQRVTGRSLDTITVVIPPRSLRQHSLGELFPIVTEGAELTVIVEFLSPDAYAYASVLQNESHDGRFVGP